MDAEGKIAVIKSFAQEIVTEEELRHLFETKEHPLAYDGFEPSGLAAIHFGLLRAKNVKKMLGIGIRFNLYIADYFAFVNKKLGGDIDHIRKAGEYFVEVWKAAGIDMDKVKVVWAKDLMDNFSYWDRFLTVGKAISLDRARRAITIMGRKEGEALEVAQLYYPAMQVTDIFQMDIDICQLGIDQRKANILAREVAHRYGWKVPVAVHHPYLLGLRGVPQGINGKDEEGLMSFKMSKSDTNSSILVHDSAADIKRKIDSAYCPEKIVEGNPIINFIDMLIVEDKSEPITIDRPQKFGGQIELKDFSDLVRHYEKGLIHPADLKAYVAEQLERKVRPIREHFEKNAKARELYETVKGYQITK
ncbi:MAG: tyrosine--tRNA ligase [Candidatus Marsarchaeota archaeon]|jgi:tyrosyl-tRNA synthetase|nr:tyrosine--tRNA ligase [Candidatus Marsarchaeota archaeon]